MSPKKTTKDPFKSEPKVESGPAAMTTDESMENAKPSNKKAAKKPAPAPAEKKPAPVKKTTKADKPAEFRFDLLNNWMELNKVVKDMDEKEAFALIERERQNRCRPNVILRLHGRFNRLRGERERTEFMQKLG